jgi:hypothetical protein
VSTEPADVVGVVRQRTQRGLSWSRANRWKAFFAGLAVVTGVAGLIALGVATRPLFPLVLLGFMVVAALPDAWKARALEAVGGLLAATAGLLGINVFFDLVVRGLGGAEADSKGWIVAGLVLAVIAFGLMAYWYVKSRGHWGIPASLAFSVFAAPAVILGAPFAVDKYLNTREHTRRAVAVPVTSNLDVLIVADRPQPSAELPAVAPAGAPVGLDPMYSVGFREGRAVRWTLVNAPDPALALDAVQTGGADVGIEPQRRPGADRLVVLLVDGTPPVIERPQELPEVDATPGEVPRWRAVARAAAGSRAPAFAFLQTTSADRIRDWTDPDSRVRPVSVQQQLAGPTITDSAVQLAIGTPGSREDFELALRHRPVLLFDSKEPVPRPLSVDALFAERKVSQCDDTETSTDCRLVVNPRGLTNGGTRLELELPGSHELPGIAKRERDAVRADGPEALKMGRPLSTMYVHPTTRDVNGRRRLYLDYWWYLPDNPARGGLGAFCGAGLVIPGVTCFDHQSDWEGVTVVIDRTERRGRVDPRPVSVHYAQHDIVVRYDWDELREHWAGDTGLPERLESIPGVEERPLVFVAKGTHAAYATRCPGIRRKCRELARDVAENRHNGKLSWAGNYTTLCGGGTSCLQLLPTYSGGTQPALWNAFRGPWGERRCVLKIYCNAGDPPKGPGQQGRYARPALATGDGSFAKGQKPFDRHAVVDE